MDGLLLFGLLSAVTFLIAVLQQLESTKGLRARLAAAPLGIGNVYAAISGAITPPFCSCSTVPVVHGMLRLRIRFGVCVTFLMASPMVSEAALVVMLRYTTYQHVLLFTALTMTIPIFVGIVLDKLNFARFVRDGIAAPTAEVEGRVEPTGAPQRIPTAAKLRLAWLITRSEVRTTTPYILLGLLIGGLIHGFVPSEWISSTAGMVSPVLLVVIMAAIGVPLYFNMVTAVPIAFELASKGVGLGPMMAFLVAGGGTGLPEMVLLTRLFKKRFVAAHVFIMFATSVAIGLVFVALKA